VVNTHRRRTRALAATCAIAILAVTAFVRLHAASSPSPHPLKLRSGERYLTPNDTESFLKSRSGTRGGVIQFEQLPTEAEKQALQSLGVELGAYLPDNAFIASIPADVDESELANYGVKWTGALSVGDKLAEVLSVSAATPDWCRDEDGFARFSFTLYPHVDLKESETWVASQYGAVVIGTSRLAHSVEVSLPTDNWQEIAADDRVLWVEPFWPRVVMNNSNRPNVKADIVQTAPYNLTGLGITVGEWDEGRASTTHPDFAGRLISGDASAVSWHGTHVAGTILGSGSASGGTYKGMAPMATLYTQQWWFSASEMETEFQNAIFNVDLRISTNSWGLGTGTPSVANCNGLLGNYFSECSALDDAVRGDLGSPVTVVWAAGNERSLGSSYCGSIGFTFGTIMPYSSAKNVITVGGLNSNNSTMYSASSWGPTDDGRVKPEIMAPACQTSADFGVTSTTPGGGYGAACGTSMATPTVSGCIALWMQRWYSAHAEVPLPSTVKAVFVETTDELGDPGPEYDWGYGRMNVQAAVDLLDQNRFLDDTIGHGETKSWTFVNNGSLTMASVTLAWDDPGAAENAAVTLINNLNLRLIPPSGPAEYLPWSLNPANPSASATTGVNTRDNLEQVRRTSAIEVGTWTVEVTGANVPQGPQRFSLAFSPGITLTSTNQAYAVSIQPTANPSSPEGVVALPFELTNLGLNNDTYDVTMTSNHGWSITGAPTSIALNSGADSALTFNMTIPNGTAAGTIDTVTAVAQSQASPATTSTSKMVVTVTSSHAISVSAAGDTVGVPGRVITITTRLSNVGLFNETINWAASSDFPWTISPSSGSAPVSIGGFVDITYDVTIPSAISPGFSNTIYIDAESVDDPGATDNDATTITVFARPPAPVLLDPADDLLTTQTVQSLSWTHGVYTTPPAGFGDFSYYIDVEEYPVPVMPVRYIAPDTFFTLPALADGEYQWKVTTFNPLGDTGLPSPARQFRIDTQAPSAPTLDQPGDSLYEADTTVTFSWQAVGDADQYKFEIATDEAFTTDVDSVWTASLSLDRVLAPCSTVVYWRVSAKDAVGNQGTPSAPHRYAVYMVGDMNFDCILNIVDVVQMVGVAFRGEAMPDPPGRAELLCNPPTDITDVVRLIEIVFRAGVPPCGPS
jgi:hypothetical protein